MICFDIFTNKSNLLMLRFFISVLAFLKIATSQQFLTVIETLDEDYEPAFRCLLSEKKFKGALLQELFVGEKQYSWAGISPAQAYKIYSQPVHAVIILNKRDNDHSRFAGLLASALKDQPVKAVWIVVSFDSINSCNQLKGYINVLAKVLTRDQSFGVLSGPEFWRDTFQEQGCPQISKIAPLLYESPYYKTFVPFGGWTKAQYVFGEETAISQCKMREYETYVYYGARQ